MSGTSEGGKKAAKTRGHENMSDMSKKGGKSTGHSQSTANKNQKT